MAEETVEIEYQLTRDTLLASYQECEAIVYDKCGWKDYFFCYVAPFLFVCFSVFADDLFVYLIGSYDLVIINIIIFFISISFVMSWIFKPTKYESFVDRVQSKKENLFTLQNRLNISSEIIDFRNDEISTKIKWSCVEKLLKRKNNFFIVYGGCQVLPIGSDIFDTEQELNEFCSLCQKYYEQNNWRRDYERRKRDKKK